MTPVSLLGNPLQPHDRLRGHGHEFRVRGKQLAATRAVPPENLKKSIFNREYPGPSSKLDLELQSAWAEGYQ